MSNSLISNMRNITNTLDELSRYDKTRMTTKTEIMEKKRGRMREREREREKREERR